MNMPTLKLKASYDEVSDVLTLYKPHAQVDESVEVAHELVIDLDKEKRIVNVELFDAYSFLHTLNNQITKKMLSQDELEVKFVNYRNYWIISLVFNYNNLRIEEKLPAFAADFKSPLVV